MRLKLLLFLGALFLPVVSAFAQDVDTAYIDRQVNQVQTWIDSANNLKIKTFTNAQNDFERFKQGNPPSAPLLEKMDHDRAVELYAAFLKRYDEAKERQFAGEPVKTPELNVRVELAPAITTIAYESPKPAPVVVDSKKRVCGKMSRTQYAACAGVRINDGESLIEAGVRWLGKVFDSPFGGSVQFWEFAGIADAP